MSNQKYLKEGALEVVTILGVYKKQCKAVENQLKKEKQYKKNWRKNCENERKEFRVILNSMSEQIQENDQSIKTLREIIKRASAGLSRDKTENTEGLKPEEVKAILDETLKAWENEK